MARSTPYKPYKVSESATTTHQPRLIDINIRGDLVNQDGDWKQFELKAQDVLDTERTRYIKGAIADKLPGYRLLCFWEVS